jgi:DNA-binding response OmpR family regulator
MAAASRRPPPAPQSEHAADTAALVIGEIEIDRIRGVVRVAGRAVVLTPKEFMLLLELGQQLGRAVRYSRLLRRVWGPEYSGKSPRTIHVHVSRLRAKLGSALRVEAVRGWGAYRLGLPLLPPE